METWLVALISATMTLGLIALGVSAVMMTPPSKSSEDRVFARVPQIW